MASQEETGNVSPWPQESLSQGTLKSEIQFLWIVTFRHSISCEFPFEVNHIKLFADDIPGYWITEPLTEFDRTRLIDVPCLSQDHKFSVFLKIERGTSKFKCVNFNLCIFFSPKTSNVEIKMC